MDVASALSRTFSGAAITRARVMPADGPSQNLRTWKSRNMSLSLLDRNDLDGPNIGILGQQVWADLS